MFVLAQGHPLLTGKLGTGITHGLQLAAVAVVAQAVLGMARDADSGPHPRPRSALIAASIVRFVQHPFSQLIAIASGAALGIVACRRATTSHSAPLTILLPRRASLDRPGALFFSALRPWTCGAAARPSQASAVFQAFYRTGALVFGGGHVVLPLLQAATVTPGWIDTSTFLAG